MVRADNKPDINGPHYYSQYWIDVALGKPSASAVAATPVSVEADEEDEDELAFAPRAAEPQPKVSKPVEKKPDTSHSTLKSLADLANIDMLMRNSAEMDDTVTPDITAGIGEHLPPSVPGLDYDVETDSTAEEPETATASQDEDLFDFDEDEEEDEDWGASRRRKPGKSKRRETHHDY